MKMLQKRISKINYH